MNTYWVVVLWLVAGCMPVMAQAQNQEKTDSLQNVLRDTRGDSARARIMLALSAAYRPAVVTKEFYFASEALTLAKKAHWEDGIINAEQLLGDCYNDVLLYTDALQHYNTCMIEARKTHNTFAEAYCLQLKYHCYFEMHDLNAALSVQDSLVKLQARLGNYDNECRQRSAYAWCLSQAGRNEESIACFRENIAFAMAHLKGTNQMDQVGDMLNTLAGPFAALKRYDTALQCLDAAMVLARKVGNYGLQAYINSSYCDVYNAEKDYDAAITYGERAVKMGQVMNSIELQMPYCKLLGQLYEREHKPAQALYYYKKFDSLTSVVNNERKTASKTMQMNKINLQLLAEQFSREKNSLDTVKRNQQMALIAAVVALLALVMLTAFIYRNLKQKQKVNKIVSAQAASLQEQNSIIDKSLKEKELLLKETHHRIKNNLQLISSLLELQAANLDDKDVKDALRAAQDRVLSIATVHGKLYGSTGDDEVEFSAFATDLFARLNTAFGNGQNAVWFDNAIPFIYLPLNVVVLLGIILNELITNSFKHAFAHVEIPVIKFSLESADGMHTLYYYDNGPGLPNGMEGANAGPLGLHLVRRLSKQLKGSASYKYDAGSIFIITFPDGADKDRHSRR